MKNELIRLVGILTLSLFWSHAHSAEPLTTSEKIAAAVKEESNKIRSKETHKKKRLQLVFRFS